MKPPGCQAITQTPQCRTYAVRVDPKVYALLVEYRADVERRTGEPISLGQALRRLLKEARR